MKTHMRWLMQVQVNIWTKTVYAKQIHDMTIIDIIYMPNKEVGVKFTRSRSKRLIIFMNFTDLFLQDLHS